VDEVHVVLLDLIEKEILLCAIEIGTLVMWVLGRGLVILQY